MKKKKKPARLVCVKCKKAFFDENRAIAHINQPSCKIVKHKAEEPTKCYHCGEMFPSKRKATMHFKKTHAEPIECSLCPNLEFKLLSAKYRHVREVHSEKKLKCSKCSYKASREWTLKRHERKHELLVNRVIKEEMIDKEVYENPFFKDDLVCNEVPKKGLNPFIKDETDEEADWEQNGTRKINQGSTGEGKMYFLRIYHIFR